MKQLRLKVFMSKNKDEVKLLHWSDHPKGSANVTIQDVAAQIDSFGLITVTGSPCPNR